MNKTKDFGIFIDNIRIPYSITESKKAKYIRLTIDIDGLRVVKPIRGKLEEVERLIVSKGKWIYKHFSRLMDVKSDAVNWNRKDGEQIYYCGERYNIQVLSHQKNNICVKLTEAGFCIKVPEKLSDEELEPIMKESFKKWYIKNARETFKERLDYFCGVIGVSYKGFKIKEQKTRWGSCSAKGNLNFNWKIIMAKPCILDYVVVHELCHLKYMNHSKNYWSLVEQYIPNYKEAQDWLKKNGMSLKL